MKISDKEKNPIQFLDKELTLSFMKVPTVSHKEDMVISFIKQFAIERDIPYEEDEYGNLYLTKGISTVYPCVTAHMDSVQRHDHYIRTGKLLPLKETDVIFIDEENGTRELCTKLYMDGMGLGCDDKCGVAIALSMLLRIDVLKCAFFVCEEVGCIGSKNLDLKFFENVGYVIGYDSPEVNRAAHTCSGTQLFTKDFHLNHIKNICEKWGVSKFYGEPFTDVKEIREVVPVQCMNFGSGYYNMHSNVEYCILEHMDNACGMGIELVKELGNKIYPFECPVLSLPWYKRKGEPSEVTYLADLGDKEKYDKYYEKIRKEREEYEKKYKGQSFNDLDKTYGYHFGDDAGYYPDEDEYKYPDEDSITLEVLSSILEKYREREELIKDCIKEKCETLGIDYESEFEAFFELALPY